MHRGRLFLYLSLAANVMLGVCLYNLRYDYRQLGIAFADADRDYTHSRRRLEELELAAKSRATNNPALAEAETLELARLRNEVTRLRNEQRGASSKSAPNPSATTSAPEQAAAPRVISHRTTSSANIFLGHTLALGAWQSATPGKQILGFMTPEISGDSVMVAARIIEMSKSQLEQLGFSQFQNGGTFTPDQFKAILQRAEQADGTDVLAMPRVITVSGREAEVSIRDRQPDGTETGPVIKVTPTIDATRTSVRLDFKFELHQPAATPPAP